MADPREFVWRRSIVQAWSDIKGHLRTVIVGLILVPLITGFVAALQGPLPTQPDLGDRLQAAVVPVLAAIGAVVVLVALVALLRAPYRQRNAARSEIRTMEGQLGDVRVQLTKATAPLTGDVFEDVTLTIDAIARDLREQPDGPPIIVGKTFKRCVITGPGAIAYVDHIQAGYCGWEADTIDQFFYEVESGRELLGVVGFLGCTFYRCRFRELLVVGTDTMKQKILEGMSYYGSGVPPEATP